MPIPRCDLTRVKLAGFKSFVDPTVVTFPSNLTGVVGPNGCGKSNVIDAVRWVMGELSARHLRGDSMADVIFNGSSSRRPVGTASVELVFDNSDGKLGGTYATYNEVSLKRVVSRDGNSAYFITREQEAIDAELRARDASAEQTMERQPICSRASAATSASSWRQSWPRPPSGTSTSCRLPHPRILVVMVSADGARHAQGHRVPRRDEPDDLQPCANYLNAHFAGMALAAIRRRLLELMSEEKALYDTLMQKVVAIGERAFEPSGEATASTSTAPPT